MEVDMINCTTNERINKDTLFLANDYFNENNPICLEERQSALFPYSKLKM